MQDRGKAWQKFFESGKDYSEPPKPCEKTLQKRKCSICDKTLRQKMIWKVSGEYFCYECLKNKSKEGK